ncbi:MAG: ThiF family adenylyltransferase [Anaerolineae bacterium]|nr:ThiF family adenylyltransferase [Anaerolineae bacterium]BCY16651.1 hypothetical protein hrd7_05000 [Leptolinea sp. HRD-7]
MYTILVNHNDDIRRLVEKGYAVAFDSNYMIVRDIPYLDAERKLQIGAIVTKLVFTDENRVIQDDHQIFFAGSVPHNLDGTPIPNLGGGATQLSLSEVSKDVVVQRSFSNKPRIAGKFQDFYEKIESYVAIISGPAMDLYQANPLTFRAVDEIVTDQIFKFHDTMTSRAEITDLSAKFNNDVVAVIGLGGTGGYLLDFLVKTPVREIRAFDLDPFYVHNAFRSPGRLEASEFNKPKAEVYHARYENFRNGLSIIPKYLDASCSDDLDGATFAFVCVDKGPSRAGIFDLLISKKIPFIDVGMGLARKNGSINGILRTTYYSTDNGQSLRDKRLAPEHQTTDDIYKTSIQISELNAMNACLAVIRFKQLRGFYSEELPFYNLAFEICDLKIVGESNTNEN